MAYDLTVGCTEISKLEGMTLNVLFPELKYNPDYFYLYLYFISVICFYFLQTVIYCF